MKTIRVSEYDLKWELHYIEERRRLLDKLAVYTTHIHHVGSTSIRNMPAKPIIDICIESQTYPPDSEIIGLLAMAGYQCMGEFGVSGRHWFRKIMPHACNLHWCPLGGEVAASQLKFKRIISNNKSLSDEYAALKSSLSNVYEEGSFEYNKMKAPFIKRVLESDA